MGADDEARETGAEVGFGGKERLKAASAAALFADICEEAFASGLLGAGEPRDEEGVVDAVHACSAGYL